jgi:hypothetical protein
MEGLYSYFTFLGRHTVAFLRLLIRSDSCTDLSGVFRLYNVKLNPPLPRPVIVMLVKALVKLWKSGPTLTLREPLKLDKSMKCNSIDSEDVCSKILIDNP